MPRSSRAQVGAVAARVGGAEAEVLVELEQRRLLGREAAVGGVRAQRRVHAERRVAGRQDQAQPGTRPQAVRDELTAQQGDAHRMAQYKWRRRARQ